MTFPIFPTHWNGRSEEGESQAHAQRNVGLPYQTTLSGNSETRTSNGLIDVYQGGGAKGEFVSIGMTLDVLRAYINGGAVPIVAYPKLENRLIVHSDKARAFKQPKAMTETTRHSFALLRMPNGMLGVVEGDPYFEETVAGKWVQDGDLQVRTLKLRYTTDGVKFKDLLTFDKGYSATGYTQGRYNKTWARWEYVLGSHYYTSAGQLKWTVGVVTSQYYDGDRYHEPKYVFLSESGAQHESFMLENQSNASGTRAARVGPKTIVSWRTDTVPVSAHPLLIVQISNDNGATWSTVGGFSGYVDRFITEASSRTVNDGGEIIDPTGLTTTLTIPGGDEHRRTVDRVHVLPESKGTCLVVVDWGAYAIPHITETYTYTAVKAYFPVYDDSTFNPFTHPAVDVVGFTEGDGRRRTGNNISIEFTNIPSTVFRIDFATGAASAIAEINGVSPEAADPSPEIAVPMGPTYYPGPATTFGKPPAQTSASLTVGKFTWSGLTAGLYTEHVSLGFGELGESDPRIEMETGTSFTGFVFTYPVLRVNYPTGSADMTITTAAAPVVPSLDGLFVPLNEDAAKGIVCAGQIKIRALFDGKRPAYLIYAEEPIGFYDPLLDSDGSRFKQRQYITEDWATFERLPDLPWPAKCIGRRRWLDDRTILLPVFVYDTPGKFIGPGKHVLFQSTDRGATWTRRGQIYPTKTDDAAPLGPPAYFDGTAFPSLLNTFAVVEWFKDDKGKTAKANPYSGAWVCDERIKPPTLE